MKRVLLILAMLISTPSLAQNVQVSGDGDISLSGKITSITRDSFTIAHSGGSSDIMFGNMNDRTIEQMREADILAVDNNVVVEGKLKDGPLNRAVIEADNIYVQAP